MYSVPGMGRRVGLVRSGGRSVKRARLFWAILAILAVGLGTPWWVEVGMRVAPAIGALFGLAAGAGAVAAWRRLSPAVGVPRTAPADLRQALEDTRTRVGATVATWVVPDGGPDALEVVGTPFGAWGDELRRLAATVPANGAMVVHHLVPREGAVARVAAGVAAGAAGVLVVGWTGRAAPTAGQGRLLGAAARQLAALPWGPGLAAAEARGARRERERLARELHDGPAQVLAYMKFKAEAALAPVGEGDPDPARMARALAAVRQEAATASDSLRATIAGLREAPELQAGLAAAADAFRRQSGVACELQLASGLPPVSGEAAANVLGVVREALANVRKHAAAQYVWVRLAQGPRGLVATVADDGRGLDGGQAGAPDHFGLAMLSERAQALGGQLTVRPRRGGGTEVRLEWPGGHHDGDQTVSAS